MFKKSSTILSIMLAVAVSATSVSAHAPAITSPVDGSTVTSASFDIAATLPPDCLATPLTFEDSQKQTGVVGAVKSFSSGKAVYNVNSNQPIARLDGAAAPRYIAAGQTKFTVLCHDNDASSITLNIPASLTGAGNASAQPTAQATSSQTPAANAAAAGDQDSQKGLWETLLPLLLLALLAMALYLLFFRNRRDRDDQGRYVSPEDEENKRTRNQ